MRTSLNGLVYALAGGAIVAAAGLAAGFGQPADPAKKPAAPAQAPGAPNAGGMDAQQAMAEWMNMVKPGEPHRMLQKLEGEWTTVTRVWMDPNGKPMESSGKATFKMVFGGRFLQQEFSGSMMGMPMQGMGLTGYDNFRHQFTGVWADSMNTAIMSMSGGISRDGKTITMFGSMDEPTTKEVGKPVKWVTRMESEDKVFFEAWEVVYGDPFRVMQVEYTRVKK